MMVWLIKAKKSPEGTLKKYPSGLIYKKQGEKWVYVAKVGTKKADDLIEEAKKQGIPVLEPTGRKTAQPTATPSQTPVSQPQPKQATQPTQATANAPTKPAAADYWTPPAKKKYTGLLDATKKEFEDAVKKMWDAAVVSGNVQTVAAQLKSLGIDETALSTFSTFKDAIYDALNNKKLVDFLNGQRFGDKANYALQQIARSLSYVKATFDDPSLQIKASRLTPSEKFIEVHFISSGYTILPYLQMSYDDLDNFIAAYAGTEVGKSAKKVKTSSYYKDWAAKGGDPEVAKIVKEFKDDIGLEVSGGSVWSRGKGTLLKAQYLRGLHKLFKGLKSEFDMTKYTPPDGKKLKVTVAAASRAYVGFYTEMNNTINISPSYTGVVLHEMGHYFWYRDKNMQNEFKQWVTSSGLEAKIKKSLYAPADITPDELKKHIDATFDTYLRAHTDLIGKMVEYKDAIAKVASKGSDARTVASASQYAEHLFWGIYRQQMINNDGKIPSEAIANAHFLTEGIEKADDSKLALLAAKIHADYPNLIVGTAEDQTKNCLMVYRDVLKEMSPHFKGSMIDNELSSAMGYASKSRLSTRKLREVEPYRRKRQYWADTNETFARSFRTYMAWKGGQKEGRSEANMSKKERDNDPFGWGFPEVDPDYSMMPSLEPILKKALGSMLLKSMVRRLAWILRKAKFDDEKIKKQIIKWLKKHPKPEDEAVHAFAERIGVNKHHLEEMVYQLLSERLEKAQEGCKVKHLRKTGDVDIWLVDGEKVRNNHDIDFAIGGHHYRFLFIPENEIWIEENVSKSELEHDILHEMIERQLMKEDRLDYDNAHDIANKVEQESRDTLRKKLRLVLIPLLKARGTHTEKRTVHRKGQTFLQTFYVGVQGRKKKAKVTIGDEGVYRIAGFAARQSKENVKKLMGKYSPEQLRALHDIGEKREAKLNDPYRVFSSRAQHEAWIWGSLKNEARKELKRRGLWKVPENVTDLEKARAMRGTGAERPGHKYIKRWWENNQWNYLYPGEGEGRERGAEEPEGGERPPKEPEEESLYRKVERLKEGGERPPEETHEVRAESGTVAQFGDRDRKLAETQPGATALDAAQPYKEYGVQLARAEKTQRPRANHISEDIGKHLRPYQADFVNLALEQFQAGQKSVVNTDGTGAGKTRQMMALANEYMVANPNAKILITTDSDRVIDNAFATDGKTMGVPFTKIAKGDEFGKGGAGIYIAPYTRLEKLKANFDDVDFAIFDESHNLKNFGRAKTDNGVAIIKAAGNCAFFSATPVDKAEHIHYLCAGLNLNFFDTMKYLGYTLAPQGTGQAWQTNLSAKIVADRINSIFEGLTEKGLMVKREVSLDNLDISIKNVNLPADQEKRFYAALNDFENRLMGLKGLAFGRAKATGLMALRRLAEEMKTQQTVDMVKEKLKEGKQVCLFATRVNETEIKGDTNQYSPGTLLAVGEMLKKEGIEFSSVFDSNPESEKEIEKFQSGKSKVILTTPESGGTGLNLDDRVGNAPRCAIVMTPPFSPIHFLQMIGRINRMTTKSKAEAVMLTIQNGPAQMIDDWNKNIIANKLVTLGAAVKGDYEKIDIEDMERVQYMNEKDAKEYMAQKKQKATVGVGSNSKFDPVVHQTLVGSKADLKAKKRKDIIANAPPVTKFDKMTITKSGDKFQVQFDYDQNIVQAIQALPQKDRFFVKHTRTWIVDAQHFDALNEIGKKHATLPDAVKLQQAQKTQGAPSRMSVGHFSATRVGDKYTVAFNYDPNLVARIKSIQGRSFDPNTKTWSVPVSEWKELEKMSKDIMKVGSGAGGGMQAPPIKETARSDALKGLQMLAQICDGARTQDQMGFSQLDVKIGHDLASKDRLTDGMFRLAQRLIRKYKRQIPQDIQDSVLSDFDVQQKFYDQNRPARKSREEVRMIILHKGKDYPEGTIRAWRGGKFKKQNGLWFRVKGGKTKEEIAKDGDAAKVRDGFRAYHLEMKEKYGKNPPHDGMSEEEKKKYDKLKLQVYKFHPDGKLPSDRQVEGTHEMRVALADAARRKVYLDDLSDEQKPIYNVLVKEGLVSWRHVAADEYIAELTDSGKRAVEIHAAHRKHAQREEERKAAKTRE